MLLLFSLIFFALVFVFSIRPGSITLWIGKIINPLFLLFLGVLIVTALLHPSIEVSAAIPDASYQNGAFFSALSQGYETMDAIAGLAFGIVVIRLSARWACGKIQPLQKRFCIPVCWLGF